MSGPNAIDGSRAAPFRDALTWERNAGGHRLGLIVADADGAAVQDASSVLQAAGLAPERRLARLRPRPGESTLRAGDVTWFVQRFGHEYAAALLPGAVFGEPAERAALEDVAAREGCAVVWR